jgi:acetoacetyl-CoA synthetase
MNFQVVLSHLLWKHDRPGHTQVEIMRRMINRKHGLDLGKREFGIAVEVHLPIWPVGTMAADYHNLHKYSVEKYTFWLDL